MNSSIKNCPFCKNQIPIHSEICPVCSRVLIERITTNYTRTIIPPHKSDPKEKEPEIKETPQQTSGPDKKETYKQDQESTDTKFEKYYNIVRDTKVIIVSTLIIIILLVIFVIDKPEKITEESKNSTSLPLKDSNTNNSNPSQTYTNNRLPESLNLEIPEKYYPTGHVFERDKYSLHGDGILLIKNGRPTDAVAKLVSMATNKSVVTTYIRRNSDLRIKKINDGIYRLYFVTGKKYDEKQNVFLENCSFSVFQEVFDYFQYPGFEVTLHPVENGTARTNSVTEEEFMAL